MKIAKQILRKRITAKVTSEHIATPPMIHNIATCIAVMTIVANSTEAQLIHEAAIGKIAGDQLLKLQTLGLTAEEAEDRILQGFLA